MGSSVSAYYDDCEDWESLCRAAQITVNWDVYSREAAYAEKGYRDKNLTGQKLIKYVERAMLRDEQQQQRQKEREEYRLYLKLKKKYDK